MPFFSPGAVTASTLPTGIDAAKLSTGAVSNSEFDVLDGGIAESEVTSLVADLALKAPLDSPTFTGTPAAPTAAANTNTTQIATCANVVASIAASSAIKGVAFAYKTGAQSIGAGTWDAIVFEAELYDSGTIHSTSSNQSRFVAPTGATSAVFWFETLNEAQSYKLYIDGAGVAGYYWHNSLRTVTGAVAISAGSYLELRAYRTAGNALTVSVGADDGGTDYYYKGLVIFL